ncbi:MAG: hypothetical protein AAF990_19215 [Bacteroidota bacterium]
MKRFALFLSLALAVSSCSKDDDTASSQCMFDVVFSAQQFVNGPSDELRINHLTVENDCLTIVFSAAGCTGDTWKINLVDSESSLDTDPARRSLRLVLKNDELCEALVRKEVSFDLSILQDHMANSVSLLIVNSNDVVLYEY